jgi:DNA-binding NarL/FixJ family response regulator
MSIPLRVPVALVDDHTLLRSMLAGMINDMPGYEVVLQANNGAEFIAALQGGLHVAVAVVDLHMPVMNGFETMTWMRSHRPTTRILALTVERSPQARARALACGAVGYALKDMHPHEFRDALDQVALVGYYGTSIVQREGDVQDPGPRLAPAGIALLTERELAFIELVCHADELTYDNIAELMDVHRRTVDGYRNSVFSKLHLHTRSGLVVFALQWGLVEFPTD